MTRTALARLRDSAPGSGMVWATVGPAGEDLGAAGCVMPDDVFEIGSLTKVLGALLLAALAEEGRVALDEPAADCLPGWSVSRRITLEQLATHTSGLPRLGLHLLGRTAQFADNPYAAVTVEDVRVAVRRAWRRPRGRFRYSNLGAALLGHALAARAGTAWEDALRDRVLGPLGMARTATHLLPVQPHRGGRPVPPWSLAALPAAGALRSTAPDLVRFLRAQLGDAPADLGAAIASTQVARAADGEGGHVGLGWMIDRDVLWHDGETGGSVSYVAVDGRRSRAVVVLANTAAPGAVARIGRAFLAGNGPR